jgi:hypothetical protein
MLMIYKVVSAGTKPDSPFLVGCFIDEVSANKFQFMEGAKVWDTATGALPTFKLTGFHGFNWTVKATSVSTGTFPTMSGSWENDDNPGDILDSDSWTASGTGKEREHGREHEDEARTAAAK